MRRDMNIFPTRDGYAISGADRGLHYEEETDDQKCQACVLPL